MEYACAALLSDADFFCIGMIAYGIINQVFDLGMTKGAVGWWQIIGAAAGFFISREYAEPRLRIPFAKGTYEQKKKAVDSYLAEMDALDKHIETLHKMQGVSQESEEQTLETVPMDAEKSRQKKIPSPIWTESFLWSVE